MGGNSKKDERNELKSTINATMTTNSDDAKVEFYQPEWHLSFEIMENGVIIFNSDASHFFPFRVQNILFFSMTLSFPLFSLSLALSFYQ